MKIGIEKVPVPQGSELANLLSDAYYCDGYRFKNMKKDRSCLEIWMEHASKAPPWVNSLMTLRNKIVSVFGLKHDGGLGDFDPNKASRDYKVGDRVGIFTLASNNENEVILADNDKHLNVKISIYKECPDSDYVTISTVVWVHNLLGRAYMLFVTPMHKLIVPSTIVRGESG